jgi:Flp pilus assembly protein TadD
MFLRRYLVLLFVVTICAAVSVPATAQEWSGTGRVAGEVRDGDGQPVAGAKVYYEMPQDRSVGPPPFVTNKKGRYGFLGLRGGRWIVRVEADGFYGWTSPAPVDVYSRGKTDDAEIVLERIPEEELIARARYEANEDLREGDKLAKEGDYDGARKEYEKVMAELDESDHPVVLSLIATTYMNEGNYPQAKATLERSLAIDPDHLASLKNMCAIVSSEGKLEEAEALLAKIPADEQVHPSTLMNIGLAHFNRGEMEQAKVYLDRVIRDNPEVADAYHFRGLTNLNLGNIEGARADFEHVLEVAPDSPRVPEVKEYLSYLTAEGGS